MGEGKYLVIGIDPGLNGAIALFDVDKDELIGVTGMPVFNIKGKKYVDQFGLASILRPFAPTIRFAFVENVHSMPKQGVASTFKFGDGFGIVKGVLAGLAIPTLLIEPNQWKRLMKVTHDKDSSRQRASQLLPSAAHLWPNKNDDGKAEAALIAYYGAHLQNR